MTGLRPAFVLAAAIVGACAPAGPAAIAPTPSGVASAGAASPSVIASPTPEPAVRAAAIGTVPASFHYFSTGQGEGLRILLFDEVANRPPVEVVHGGPLAQYSGPDVRYDAFDVSADGRVLVLMRRESEQRTAYYLIRPESGEVRSLLSGPDLGLPVLSADGQRIAYTRTSSDPSANGLWILSIGDALAPGRPGPARLVSDDPQRVGSPPRPLAWSPDGTWLAIGPVLGPGGHEVAVVDPAGGETHFDAQRNTLVGGKGRVIGPGRSVDWRGGERNLLVTSSRDAFGGRTEVYTADVLTGAMRSLYRPPGDVVLAAATWHPALDRYAVTEGPLRSGPGTSSAIWLRGLNGGATKVAEGAFYSIPWWSRDGTKLFAAVGGDDSTGYIANLLGTGGGTVFCQRGGTVPPCT